MKTRFLGLIIALLFSIQGCYAQKNSFSDRLFTGGNIGFQFGDATVLDLSPILGYKLTNQLVTGLGFTYKYYKFNDFFIYQLNNGQRISKDYKGNYLGGSLFARYYLKSNDFDFLNQLFLHTEFEHLIHSYTNYYPNESRTDLDSEKTKIDVQSIFVGGGLRQPLGQRASAYIMVLWNLNETTYSPYNNPILRIGFNLGL